MQHKFLHRAGGQRTYAVVLETGDEVNENVSASSSLPRQSPSRT